jgi:hypothetical protein
MMKKAKVTKLRRIEDFISYLSSKSSVLLRGIHWVSWWSVKHQKSILPQKTLVRPDISGFLAGFQRLGLSALSGSVAGFQWLWPDMSGPQPGPVWPNPIPQRPSLGPNISNPQAGFQRGWLDMSGPDPNMSGFLTLQRLDSLGGL